MFEVGLRELGEVFLERFGYVGAVREGLVGRRAISQRDQRVSDRDQACVYLPNDDGHVGKVPLHDGNGGILSEELVV